MSWLHFSIVLPFLYAVFIPLLYKNLRRIHTGWFVLVVPLLLFTYFLSYLPLNPHAPVIHAIPWIPSLDIYFTVHLDGLALLFALIITGMGALVVLYSIYYMSKEREALHNFYVYLLMFMGSMLGIVTSNNLLITYVFWEITSISSFLLIAYWYQRKRSRYGAKKSLLITVTGGFAMLLGFIMLYVATGTWNIRELIGLSEQFSQHILFIPSMLLILFGAFTKSAQFPFHIWLPDAMEAPTPISAYLHSATMVKAGVYLIARLTSIYGGNLVWFWVIVAVGIMTLFWGSFMAIRQTDLKALLAYSTVSQLGLITSLLGIGSLSLHPDFSLHTELFVAALLAAIFHLVNHSIFKGCLFMVIGILDHETGTRDIRKLGGLMSVMPISFTLALVGGLSMAGLPPFSGFLSKEMFFTGVLTAFRAIDTWVIWLPIIAWVASVLTFVYSLVIILQSFTGPLVPERLDKKPKEAPIGMLVSPIILASLVVIIFFFPNVLSIALLEPALHAVIPTLFQTSDLVHSHIKAWHGLNTELWMTIGIIVVGVMLYRNMSKWTNIYVPLKFTLNQLYDRLITSMERRSHQITSTYMTGYVHNYISYIFIFLILLLTGSLILQGGMTFDFSHNATIALYEYVLGFALIAATVFVLFSKSRLTSIIAVSAVGFLVSLFYVIFRAPDLALTQLVVETISTALFLLCFYFLPKLNKELSRMRVKLGNAIIAIGVGATLTVIGLYAQGYRVFEPIANFYERAEELSGARNMVNAILVDFRAFDTMLEIVVLFTAGIGVYTLIKLRQLRRDDQ